MNGTGLQQPFQLNSNTSLRKSESNNEAKPDKQRRSEAKSAKKSRARDSVLPGTISNSTDRKAQAIFKCVTDNAHCHLE